MPEAFTKEKQEEIRAVFRAGVRLSRALGVQRMTVSRLTTACGIAKGSFYSFYQSKEEFILALAAWANRKAEEMLSRKLAGRRQMSTHEFFEFFREFMYSEYDLMNGLTVDDFLWLLEPIGFSVMLPEGINTPLKKLTKAQIKPIRLMEFILYPIMLAYIIISAYEAGINGFCNLFFTAFIENLFWNFGDFFLLDWLLRAKYTDRLMVPGTEDNELWKTGPWMKKFGIVDHWIKGPICCAVLSLLCAGIGMLIR